jgi:hypothetical protein
LDALQVAGYSVPNHGTPNKVYEVVSALLQIIQMSWHPGKRKCECRLPYDGLWIFPFPTDDISTFPQVTNPHATHSSLPHQT